MTNAKTRSPETLAEAEGHREKLRAVIGKRIRDQAEAEDVLQDVFVEFLEANDLGLAIETLGAWLVQVAKNKIVDRFRRKQTRDEHAAREREAEPAETPSADRPDDEWVRKVYRAEIVEGLAMLPEKQRAVFVMHELEGKSFEEIAEATGENVNTLLSRKRQAVLFLRNHLQEVYDELE